MALKEFEHSNNKYYLTYLFYLLTLNLTISGDLRERVRERGVGEEGGGGGGGGKGVASSEMTKTVRMKWERK